MTSLKIYSLEEARDIKVASLPHNYMTLANLFISSRRGYSYQIWVVKTTP